MYRYGFIALSSSTQRCVWGREMAALLALAVMFSSCVWLFRKKKKYTLRNMQLTSSFCHVFFRRFCSVIAGLALCESGSV